MNYIRQAEEAIKLGQYAIYDEAMVGIKIAEICGCKPSNGDGHKFGAFIGTVYHYGVIQGIRQERARRKSL